MTFASWWFSLLLSLGSQWKKEGVLTAQTDYEMTHVNESMYEFFINYNSMHKKKENSLKKSEMSARGDWWQSNVTVLWNCLFSFLTTTIYIEEFTQKIYETIQSNCNKQRPKWNTMKGVRRNNLTPNLSTLKQSFMIYVNGLPKIDTTKQKLMNYDGQNQSWIKKTSCKNNKIARYSAHC